MMDKSLSQKPTKFVALICLKLFLEFFGKVLKIKKEVIAYVKNLSKDGSFYWALAFVAPSFDSNGEVMGIIRCA
ncbi:PAS domain-containing protein [Campylobacter armoricus]|uniref:PAS domain-containing protein n=1 Tax=Campylobacter armoricus TaxID=2505970 RepID=UPI001116BA42|nr:PAS domain-containing protein [Campylobacter armoricus]